MEPKPVYDAVTRAYNVLAAAVGLVLLSPLLALIALAVKLTSPGPILYKGQRVGLGERIYDIYKFRTMKVGAEQRIGNRLVRQDEDHFTPIGRFMRKYRLDELPQLINVLKGDMNLVGPRPLRPIFLDEYKRTIPGYYKRFLVRPGITGQAQVRGGYYTSPRDKLRYEMLYIAHRSVLFDLELVFLTFLRVMTRLFTTGFILAWLVAALMILPGYVYEMFEVQVGAFRFSLVYLVPVLAAVWLLVRREVTDGRIYFLRTPVDGAWLGFVALSLVGVAFSHSPMVTFRGSLYYVVTGAVVFYLVLNSAVVKAQARAAVILFTSLAMLIALLGLLELAAAWRYGPGLVAEGSLYRMESTLGSTLGLATILVLAQPLALALFLTARSARWRVFWGLGSMLVLVTVVMTFTRTALVGVFLSLWLFLKDRHRKVLVVSGLVVVLLATALSRSGDQRFDPGGAVYQAGRELERQGELLSRFTTARLVIGVGARSLPSYLKAQRKQKGRDDGSALPKFNNMYLTLLVENGFVGLFLFLTIVWLSLKKMLQASNEAKDQFASKLVRATYSGVAGFLVLLLAFDGLKILALEVLFWASLGYGLGLAIHSSPRPPEYYRVVHFRERLF